MGRVFSMIKFISTRLCGCQGLSTRHVTQALKGLGLSCQPNRYREQFKLYLNPEGSQPKGSGISSAPGVPKPWTSRAEARGLKVMK